MPQIEFDNTDDYVAPRNNIEQQICNAYAETLGLNRSQIGIKDNFFKIGGDSILSIQLVSKLRKLGFRFNVKNIHENKTVEQLALYLDKK